MFSACSLACFSRRIACFKRGRLCDYDEAGRAATLPPPAGWLSALSSVIPQLTCRPHSLNESFHLLKIFNPLRFWYFNPGHDVRRMRLHLNDVVELSQSSWLAAGVVPGIERRPLKKLDPDPTALLHLVEGWRDRATKAGRAITRDYSIADLDFGARAAGEA